ncbi:ABC transporter permease [Catalinimonas alkaloidigena]|nr:ABC transporter permease [Catalinimonas alkaloidigena]
MLKTVLTSFALALHNIRTHFLHTMLSVLGIVIGVAALVGILSLIDGMESYAHEQVSTTSLRHIIVGSQTTREVDHVRIAKDTYPYLNYERFQKLMTSLPQPIQGNLYIRQPTELLLPDTTRRLGLIAMGTTAPFPPHVEVEAGELFTEADVRAHRPVVVVNRALARQLVGTAAPETVVGQTLSLRGETFRVVGLFAGDGTLAQAYLPITLFSEDELRKNPPQVFLEAPTVEDVPVYQAAAEAHLRSQFPDQADDFFVSTNEGRVQQANRGFLIFRLVMGFITGLSVLVGGIGVMNVMLISVTERTMEIGIRKATGAKRRDILLQFLSESVTISGFGSLLGLIVGMLGSLVLVAVLRHITEAPFQVAFTASTLGFIAGLALLIGVVFGTYPALRAARLDPVDAIRHE